MVDGRVPSDTRLVVEGMLRDSATNSPLQNACSRMNADRILLTWDCLKLLRSACGRVMPSHFWDKLSANRSGRGSLPGCSACVGHGLRLHTDNSGYRDAALLKRRLHVSDMFFVAFGRRRPQNPMAPAVMLSAHPFSVKQTLCAPNDTTACMTSWTPQAF